MLCRTPPIAEESAAKIYELYENYKEQADFVGMDMARKFLQMGYTRAMRYAKHKGGKKYDSNHELLPESINQEKIDCAQASLKLSGHTQLAPKVEELHTAAMHKHAVQSNGAPSESAVICRSFMSSGSK